MNDTRCVSDTSAVAAMSRPRVRSVQRTAHCVFVVTCLLGATVADLHAQPTRTRATEPTPMRGFRATPTVNMRIFLPAGRVRVAVWDRDSISVSGTIGINSSMFGGGRPDFVKFGVEPLRTGDTRLAEADWLVTVPRRAHVWVKVTVGTIETAGTAGELELYAVGGSITVRQATGVISVESIDATVVIDGARGDVRVRGSKAAITLHDVGGTASVTSVSGTVTLTGAAPECRVETIGGDVSVDATRLRGALAELQTHAGAIRIGVSAQRPPILDLTSRSGRVTQPPLIGAAANGRVVARSFRGSVTVATTTAAVHSTGGVP